MNRKLAPTKNNKGFTLVELVVTFALLGIFFVAITITMTGSTRTYYQERSTMAAYTVADGVLSEIQSDVRTILPESEGGYIKIRDKGKTKPYSGGTISGNNIEFACSNDGNGGYAEKISTDGYTGELIQNKKIINSEVKNVRSGYLNKIFYGTISGETETISMLYADEYIQESILVDLLQKEIGTKIAADALQPLMDDFYQSFTVSLNFELTPDENQLISYIKVTVNVYKNGDVKYSKSKYIDLQNPVEYKNGKTLYSDTTQTESTYTITFDANGGTPRSTYATLTAGAQIGSYPTVNNGNYTLAGWFTVDGIQRNEQFIPNSSLTIYAHWKSVITYATNGANETVSPQDVNKPDVIGTLPTVTKDNYTFAGWFRSDGITQIDSSYVPTGSETVYAHWQPLTTYTVTFVKKNEYNESVADANLVVLNSNNKIINSWTTVLNENYTVDLAPGTYTLKEVSAPTDYETAADVSFTVSDNGLVLCNEIDVSRTITMIDKYKSTGTLTFESDTGVTVKANYYTKWGKVPTGTAYYTKSDQSFLADTIYYYDGKYYLFLKNFTGTIYGSNDFKIDDTWTGKRANKVFSLPDPVIIEEKPIIKSTFSSYDFMTNEGANSKAYTDGADESLYHGNVAYDIVFFKTSSQTLFLSTNDNAYITLNEVEDGSQFYDLKSHLKNQK